MKQPLFSTTPGGAYVHLKGEERRRYIEARRANALKPPAEELEAAVDAAEDRFAAAPLTEIFCDRVEPRRFREDEERQDNERGRVRPGRGRPGVALSERMDRLAALTALATEENPLRLAWGVEGDRRSGVRSLDGRELFIVPGVTPGVLVEVRDGADD